MIFFLEKGDIEKERNSTKIPGNIGQFHTSALYIKLYEILKGAHCSYKVNKLYYITSKSILFNWI